MFDIGWRDHAHLAFSVGLVANLLFTYELDRRLRAKESDTIAVAVHPGGASTELSRYVEGGFGARVQRRKRTDNAVFALGKHQIRV